MTNQEIVQMQRRNRRLSERVKTIIPDLRLSGHPLMFEAIEIIEWLLTGNLALRNELNQEIKEGQHQAREAYAQGQQDEYDKNRRA